MKNPQRQKTGCAVLGMLLLIPVLSQSYYAIFVEGLVNAADEGDRGAVNRLLILGADVDCVEDDGGATPLIAAAAQNHPDVVRLLIRRGADVNKAETYFFNNRGLQTPLQAASGHPEIIAMLKQAGAKE